MLVQVSNNLMQAHEECWVGDYTSVLKWQQAERARLQSGKGGAAAASLRQQTEGGEVRHSNDGIPFPTVYSIQTVEGFCVCLNLDCGATILIVVSKQVLADCS